MLYTALDFETANNRRDSACSVGLAKFDEEGILIDTFYTLLKPPVGPFDRFMVSIHGIREQDVVDAPSFSQVWSDLYDFIGESLVVAHNADFDMGILFELITALGEDCPDIRYLCTVRLARVMWPHFDNHKLTTISQEFGLEYRAHYALDDAINCGKIFGRACRGKLYDEKEFRKFLLEKRIDIKSLRLYNKLYSL